MRKTKPKSTDQEKRRAVCSVVPGVLFRLLIAGLLFYCWDLWQPGLMKTVLLVLAVGNLITVPFTFVVLGQRLREIEKGELDEARKY